MIPSTSGRPGRLLVLTSTWPRWPGDTTTSFVGDLTSGLAGLGWNAHVLAPHAPGAARDEVQDGVAVHRFRYLWPESAQTVCYGSGALVNLRERPLELAKVPMLVAAEQRATIASVRRWQPDVIHAHWLIPQGLVAGLVPGANAPPAVVTVHGGDVFALDQPGVRSAKRMALRRAAAITVNSSATERAVLDLGAEPSKVHRIPMGIDVDRPPEAERVAALRAEHRVDGGPLCVLVGRVLAEKGVFDLVDAVAIARDDGRTITAVVVGEGRDRKDARDRARQLGVADRIAFVGWVDPDEVPSWLAAADIVVAPSRTAPDGWVEAQGLAIAEAMAAERPVVATRTGGIADAVTDGETGVLVSESDPTALAREVLALHDEPDRAGRLAATARRRAVEQYAASATTERMSAVLVEAAAAARREPSGPNPAPLSGRSRGQKSPRAHPVVFVVSTGRTGTTFLAQAAGDMGAEGCHEPGPWWLRHLSNAYVSGHLDHDRAVQTLRSRRPTIGIAGPYLEASCLIYGLVAPLLDAFPEARVVQVVRDPRTYVRSGLAWGAYRFGGRALNLAPYRRLAPPQLRPLDPAARLRWAADDQFARLAWAWAAMNEAMRTQGTGDDRFRTVRFEDLTDPDVGPEVLGALAEDLGLTVEVDRLADITGDSVNASRTDTGGNWRSWSDARLRLLRERTAEEAAHYGYPVAAEVDALLAAR